MPTELNLQTLLDKEIHAFLRKENVNVSDVKIEEFISGLKNRITEMDPIRLVQLLKNRIMRLAMDLDEKDIESHVWYNKFLKLIEEIETNEGFDKRQIG